MRAGDLMTSPVITVYPWTPVKEAAGLLASCGFTALPVLDDDERLIGIVTEADLIRDQIARDPRYPRSETAADEAATSQQTVSSVMTTPVTALGAGTDVTEVGQVLLEAGIRVIPIVDGATVIGIVTRGDLVRARARTDDAIAVDIRHRLEVYGGADRWAVEVHEGTVRIVDAFGSDTDHQVATLLAQAVPGVVTAETVSGGTPR
jgi:CBS domain-containing protein